MTFATVMTRYKGAVPRGSMLHRAIRGISGSLCAGCVMFLSKLRRFEVPREDGLALYAIAMLCGFYEKGSIDACRRVLPRGGVAIDVGAHAGYFALALSKAVGRKGKVLACEPCSGTYQILMRNLRRKRARNVIAWKLAVGARSGTGTLHHSRQSPGHSILPVKSFVGGEPVDIVSVDDLVRRYALDHVDLIKIDVEGAEPDVLDGMEECRRRSPRLSILFEFKPEYLFRRGCRPQDLSARLQRHGLIPYAVGPKGRLLEAGPDLQVSELTPPFNILAVSPSMARELGLTSVRGSGRCIATA